MALPEELKKIPRWILWRLEWNGQKKKWNKSPYSAIPEWNMTHEHASSTNPASWADFATADAALQWGAGKYNGLGFVLTGSGYTCVDLDHSLNDGNASDLAADVLDMFGSTPVYTEISQSGEGLHIFCGGSVPTAIKKKEIEVYSDGRYIAMTGNQYLPYSGIANAQSVLDALYKKFKTPEKKPKKREPAPANSLSMDDAWVMNRAAKNQKFNILWAGDWEKLGYPSQSEADAALCSILAYWCDRDIDQIDRLFRQSGLYREKWDRDDYSINTIAFACAQCTVTAAEKDLQRRQTKAAAGTVMELVQQDGAEATSEDDGLREIVGRLLSLKPSDNPKYQNLDDLALSSLFVDLYRGTVLFNIDTRCWYVWTGRKWQEDRGNILILRQTQEFHKAVGAWYATRPDFGRNTSIEKALRWLVKTSNREKMLKDAAAILNCCMKDFDRNQKTLNLRNGILDLESGELLAHAPQQMNTKICNVDFDPESSPEVWEKFVVEIMEGDPEKVRYLQQLCGYLLTGENTLEQAFCFYGERGRNGKDSLLGTIQAMLNDYAVSMNPESLAKTFGKNGSAASPDIARLRGARMIHLSEVPAGMNLDGAQIKRLTGNSVITARGLHQSPFDFVVRGKMIINCNFIPACQDKTVFSTGRLQVLPFTRHFQEDERDLGLKGRLLKRENMSACLNWCLAGLRDMNKNGGRLSKTEAVETATRDYQRKNDRFAQWLEECYVRQAGAISPANKVYLDSYTPWCKNYGYLPVGKIAFIDELRSRGLLLDHKKIGGKTYHRIVPDMIFLPPWEAAERQAKGEDSKID